MGENEGSTASTATPVGDTPVADVPVLQELPAPVPHDRVVFFLEPYGYRAQDACKWSLWAPLPELEVNIIGHGKVGKHTYYQLECTLARPGEWHSPYLRWRCGSRLSHLREGLHDQVKRELGSSYREQFEGAHFAHSYGVPGTTARLNSWCRRLAMTLNKKLVPPAIAAAMLQLFGAPSAGSFTCTMHQSKADEESSAVAPGAGTVDGATSRAAAAAEDVFNPFAKGGAEDSGASTVEAEGDNPFDVDDLNPFSDPAA
mmetsp:Transcript_107176/g.301642  ORF Transcript_107176/g.301642 Transcript_107176/m.301642 type:complete len:258 (-) Transcript_107176:154-927(-)